MTATVRYDPWGGIIASSGTTPDWRFQGSWYDTSTDLQWVVTRWYASALGRFISEDTLLGEPTNPLSRHLYVYAGGQPCTRIDLDGRGWVFGTCGRVLLDSSNQGRGIFKAWLRVVSDRGPLLSVSYILYWVNVDRGSSGAIFDSVSQRFPFIDAVINTPPRTRFSGKGLVWIKLVLLKSITVTGVCTGLPNTTWVKVTDEVWA